MATMLDTPKGVGGKIDTNLSGSQNAANLGGTFNASTGIITPDTVKPVQPITVPPVQTPTGVDNTLGYLDSFSRGLQKKADAAQAASTSSFQDLISSLSSTKTPTELSNTALSQTGADKYQSEVADLQSQLEQEQYALRKETEAIQKNAGGDYGTATQDKISEANAASLSKQADIAILLSAKTRQYDVAKQIADRAVQAQIEVDQRKNDTLKYIYEQNKDLFTTAEQRSFETQQADRNRALDLKAYMLKADYQNKLDNASNNLQFVSGTATQPSGVFNKRTGEFTPYTPTGDGFTPEQEQNLSTVNDINNIINSPAFDSTFGVFNTLNRLNPLTGSYGLSQNVNQLVSQLSLAARGQLKGQGQISDFEGKILRDAQTALTLNMQPADALKELVQVRGAIRTSSGLSATVKITDPSTGESMLMNANQAQITQAVADGAYVEYQ